MAEVKDDINRYLTWGNLWKLITLICASVWVVNEQLSSDTARDFEVNQTKKDVTEIKSIVKDIQSDIKTGTSKTDNRLNTLEQEVGLLRNDLNYLKGNKDEK